MERYMPIRTTGIPMRRNKKMRESVGFEDDILIIDELEDGETYHVTVPCMAIDILTQNPRSILVYDKNLDTKIDQLLLEAQALRAKIRLLQNQQDNQNVRPYKEKMLAAIRLITADTSVYHRFWGEVRTVSVDKDGNVFFGPRAMNRERPDEQPKSD